MIELASALALPIAKLLLKSYLGDTAAGIGVDLSKLGLNRLGDWQKARAAQHQAEAIADAVVSDLGTFFTNEHVAREQLAAPASALGDTIGRHVGAAFLVYQRFATQTPSSRPYLDTPALPTRSTVPPTRHRISTSASSRLSHRGSEPSPQKFQALRSSAMPGCFSRWQLFTKPRRRSWQSCARSGPVIEDTARGVRQLVDRPEKRLAEGYARDYLDALSTELNRVEIIGLTVDEPARGGELEVAYLSLNASIGIRGERRRIHFATLLTLLPQLGNRILIEGPAGAGKSTLPAGPRSRQPVTTSMPKWPPRTRSPSPRTSGSWLPLFLGEAELPLRRAGQPDLAEGAPRDDPTEPLKRQLAATCWRTRIPFFIPLRRTKQPIDMERLPKLPC